MPYPTKFPETQDSSYGSRRKMYKKKGKMPFSYRQQIALKQMIHANAETKIFDTNHPSNTVLSTGTIIGPLCGMSQGSGDLQRNGDRIYIRKLYLRQTMLFADTTNFIRVIIFQWIPNNASITPTFDSLLQNTGQPITNAINDTNNTSLFRLLSDITYSLSSTGDSGALVRNTSIFGKRLGRHILEFNPGLPTGFNQIYVCVVGDSAAAPNPTYSLYSRLTYSDA